MRAMGWKGLAVVLSVVALGSLSTHAQEQQEAGAGFYSFGDLKATWEAATRTGPLETRLVTFLTDHLVPRVSSEGTPGRGVILLEEPEKPPSSPEGESPSVKALPVTSLEPELARDLHRRAALHARLLSMLRDYGDRTASAQRSHEIQELANTVHLELFMAHTLFYLEGQTRQEKCLSYQRAVEHARYLGWRDAASQATPPRFRPRWEELAASARAFHDTGFTSRIPERLCALRPAASKSEDEQRMRASIDAKLLKRVKEKTEETLKSLEAKEKEYAAALKQSTVQVPTRDIFALRRAVEDSSSLHGLVSDDALKLKDTLERLRQQRGRLEAIQQNASTGGLDDITRQAREHLDTHQKTLGELLRLLREIEATPGLEGSVRSRLSVCSTLSEQVTAEGLETFVTSLDDCLRQVARAYGDLKERQGANPDAARFAKQVAELSKGYIGFVNSHTSGSQGLP